jgi:hypothetical protein
VEVDLWKIVQGSSAFTDTLWRLLNRVNGSQCTRSFSQEGAKESGSGIEIPPCLALHVTHKVKNHVHKSFSHTDMCLPEGLRINPPRSIANLVHNLVSRVLMPGACIPSACIPSVCMPGAQSPRRNPDAAIRALLDPDICCRAGATMRCRINPLGQDWAHIEGD